MRMRDRRGPIAALLLVAGYAAALLWAQIAFAAALGAPIGVTPSPIALDLIQLNAWLLGWRLLMRAAFTANTYGWREGLRAIPRAIVANLISILAAYRALKLHSAGGPRQWDKTQHIYPREIPIQ